MSWIVIGVHGNVFNTAILDRDVVEVETNVVAWSGLWKRFVMHLNGLDFSGDVDWGKSDGHTRKRLIRH